MSCCVNRTDATRFTLHVLHGESDVAVGIDGVGGYSQRVDKGGDSRLDGSLICGDFRQRVKSKFSQERLSWLSGAWARYRAAGPLYKYY